MTHIVFSTKHRAPVLDVTLRPRLHAYLATVARSAQCECYRAGGTADHVHLALRLSRTVSVAKVMEEIKSASSKWLKTQAGALAEFAWQRGYGAFSLGPEKLEGLLQYIDHQEQHHASQSFQDEFLALLASHGLDYDERYVWD
ncbi:MAG: IS200/IS605 family transposase [Gammaproteobacteria bacterium]|nr:IS200/IS605 family transposase [Gammaproteobacteria bacterium]